MPEFGDFPNLPVVNEDDLISDLAKFNRKSFPKNDPEVSMDCPPWWRIKCDGYGGQNSLEVKVEKEPLEHISLSASLLVQLIIGYTLATRSFR